MANQYYPKNIDQLRPPLLTGKFVIDVNKRRVDSTLLSSSEPIYMSRKEHKCIFKPKLIDATHQYAE